MKKFVSFFFLGLIAIGLVLFFTTAAFSQAPDSVVVVPAKELPGWLVPVINVGLVFLGAVYLLVVRKKASEFAALLNAFIDYTQDGNLTAPEVKDLIAKGKAVLGRK